MFRIHTLTNLNLVGIFGGGSVCVPYYIPEGRCVHWSHFEISGCVPYFFPDRRFYSGQPILHFVIVTYDFNYFFNCLDKNDETEFTFFHGMIFRNFLHHRTKSWLYAAVQWKLFFMLNGRKAFSNLCQIVRTLGTVGSLWTYLY